MPELPPNSRPLYRILTEKSRPGFGKYTDFTVSDILKVQPSYIAYLYFQHPQISFKEEILQKASITRRIAKPGTDIEGYREWERQQRQGLTPEQIRNGKIKRARLKKKKALGAYLNARKAEAFTKGQLQAINHGHPNK